MTIIAEDDDGNEVIVRVSSGIAKMQMDDGFGDSEKDRERVLSVLRARAALENLSLIDMDEVRSEVEEIPQEEMEQMGEGDEIDIEVEDLVTDMPIEISIEATKIVPAEEADANPAFFDMRDEREDD